MNTINCSCGREKDCGCCKSCKFDPCAVTCGCPDTKEYGYVYNLSDQTVCEGEAVTFSDNGLLSAGVSHTACTSEIVIQTTGVYLVEFYIRAESKTTFSVYLNGSPVAGSRYEGEDINVGKVILPAQRGDVITIVNSGRRSEKLEKDDCAVNASVTVLKVF